MKKLLVVSDNKNWQSAVAKIASEVGFDEIISAEHENALAIFLEREPTHILVGEYEHEKINPNSRFAKAARTWQDLKAAAQPSQTFIRCGFSSHSYEDYLRLPFSQDELTRAMKLMKP